MEKAIILTNINIRKKIVKTFFKSINSNIEFEITNVDDIYTPPQMINSADIYIKSKINNYNDDNTKYILCIYNILKIIDCKITDSFLIILKDNINSKIYEITGSELNIDFTILNEYPLFVNIIDDLYDSYQKTSNKYIFDGCDSKLSTLINKYYPNIQEDKWINQIFNKDNNNRVTKLLNKLSKSKNENK